MGDLTPLSMSQTKEDLLKHLDLPPATYALMAVSSIPSIPQPPSHLESMTHGSKLTLPGKSLADDAGYYRRRRIEFTIG